MNHAMLQRIVEEVAARLLRRALSTATLSVAQLGEADIRSLLCQHASLRIVQVDLPLLEQLAGRAFVEELIYADAEMRPMTFRDYPRGAGYLLALRERVAAEIESRLA